MPPIEREPHLPPPKESEDKTPAPPLSKKWVPTEEAFEKFLAVFSSNRDEAGQGYELARRKLVRYFERHAVMGAERCADETLDRAMRRINEGIQVSHLMPYLLEIARFVFMETWKEEEKLRKAFSTMQTEVPPTQFDTGKTDVREDCFDRCLDELAPESRTLILTYFDKARHAKIEQHTDMANSLGLTLNALRIRIHRIRATLEACVKKCMDQVSSHEMRATRNH
jgi:DNA-directed RNA polymerase specialized sigma24 family protein